MSNLPSSQLPTPLPLSQQALEAMPFAMTISHVDGRIVARNLATVELFRLTPEQAALSFSHNAHTDVAHANGFTAAFARACAGERVTTPPIEYNYAAYGLSPGPIWLTISVFPFPLPDGTIPFVGMVYQDVTAQIQAEEQTARLTDELAQRVREFEPFYALAEYAPDGFCLSDFQQRVTYANQAIKQLTGYGDDIVGRLANELIIDEGETLLQESYQALQTSGLWQDDVRVRHRDGHFIPCHVSVTVIKDEQGQLLGAASILRDLTAQQQAEAERAALQEQIITSQEAAIRELSTPLIPLADGIVVMPLIGTLTRQRAMQVMEVLLEGIVRHQAQTVLLDISGVHMVDTQVADTLLQVASAVKLLGAQVVLTGISAEVAQTMVHLDADLTGIVTQSTLQAGLRYALNGGGQAW